MRKIINSSVTVMVPAYNEEGYLESTVKSVSKIVNGLFKDYEILIFDDCSTDRTGEIADALAKNNKKIKAFHNKINKGLGYNYRQGVKIAQEEYFCWIPADRGDNAAVFRSIENFLTKTGKADIITSYFTYGKPRPLYRYIISDMFTGALNFLFGHSLKYYCGFIICKVGLLRGIKMRTDSFAMQAEVLIQLLEKGYSHKEYLLYEPQEYGSSAMFRFKNLAGVVKTMVVLFFQIYLGRLRLK
jgi:glycosyltransferase involved in cell wall biosynthesis